MCFAILIMKMMSGAAAWSKESNNDSPHTTTTTAIPSLLLLLPLPAYFLLAHLYTVPSTQQHAMPATTYLHLFATHYLPHLLVLPLHHLLWHLVPLRCLPPTCPLPPHGLPTFHACLPALFPTLLVLVPTLPSHTVLCHLPFFGSPSFPWDMPPHTLPSSLWVLHHLLPSLPLPYLWFYSFMQFGSAPFLPCTPCVHFCSIFIPPATTTFAIPHTTHTHFSHTSDDGVEE